MEGPRLQITEGMRRFLDYPRFAGPTRMLVLETGYFFDRSWVRAAEEIGWQARLVPSAMVGAIKRDQVRELFTTVGEFKPDFILTSNYAGMDMKGMFARFFEDARIPYVSWFTDTPRMILHGREVHTSHYSVAATWERAYTQHFHDLGFTHVLFMPLATDPALFSGAPAARFDRELAFVGTSMIKLAGEAWEKLRHLPELTAALLDAFARGRVSRERFARGIHAILPPALLEGRTPSELRHIELCLVYEFTRRARCTMVQRLEPLGLEVRGDAEWATVTARSRGPVGYFEDLSPFYRGTAVNLNTTSLQMKTAVNQRVFDCPAGGGFLITDAQADLEEFFDPETEIVTYRSLDELEDKVGWFLARPQERTAIARCGHDRVMARHTHRHRLESLEAYLKERFCA